MSEFSFQTNTSKKPNFSTLLLADLFNFCFFILSHPLYLSYFIFFSPYLLKLLSFLSPLFITTSLLVLAYLTFSPTLVHDNVANSELSEIKPGFLVTTYQTVLERLQKSKVLDHTDGDHGGDDHEEFRSFVELEAYKIVFDTSNFDIGENPVEENCSQQVFEAPVEEICSEVVEAPVEEKCSQVFEAPVEENCSQVFEAQVEDVVSSHEANVLDNSGLFEAANDVFDENPAEVAWPGVETLIEHWSKNIVGTKVGKEVKKLSSQPNKVEEDGKAKWSIKRASKDLTEFNIPSQNQLTTEKVTHSVASHVKVSEFVPSQDQLTIGEVTQLITSPVKISEFIPSQDQLTIGEVTQLVTSPVKISEFSDASPVKLSEFFDAGQFFTSSQNLSNKPSGGEIPKRRGDKFGSQDINAEFTGQDYDLGSFGSMRKEKEWRRTLACKLFEERHQNVDCGGEGMDMLWETYDDQTESIKVMKGKSKSKKGKNGKVERYNEDDEGEEEELDNGQLCCLQALKFSAGKMNMGMGRPNLVKFSKALKGFGWLHHVTKHGKKGYH